MDNIVQFAGETLLDISPTSVVESALDVKFKYVMVIGICEEDGVPYIAASTGATGDNLYLLECAKDVVMGRD